MSSDVAELRVDLLVDIFKRVSSAMHLQVMELSHLIPFLYHRPLPPLLQAFLASSRRAILPLWNPPSFTSFADPPTFPTILWNPTLHKYVEIPDSPCRFQDHQCSISPDIGFWFDTRQHFGCPNVDYRYFTRYFHSKMAIGGRRLLLSHSHRGKSYRRPKFSTTEPLTGSYIYAYHKGPQNGVFPHNCYMLLMFDCEHEEFTTMMLPEAINRQRYDILKLVVLNGMLSMVLFTSSRAYFWVMQEYGVASSWKQLQRSVSLDMFDLVLEESLFLMDAKIQSVSYLIKRDNNDGEVYYEIDGKTYEDILV